MATSLWWIFDCSRSFWNVASSNYAGNKLILKILYCKGKLHLNLALWSYFPNSSFYKNNDFWLNFIPLMKTVAQNMKNKLRTLNYQKKMKYWKKQLQTKFTGYHVKRTLNAWANRSEIVNNNPVLKSFAKFEGKHLYPTVLKKPS